MCCTLSFCLKIRRFRHITPLILRNIRNHIKNKIKVITRATSKTRSNFLSMLNVNLSQLLLGFGLI